MSGAADSGRPWFPPDAEPSPQQRAKQALATRLRSLIADVLYVDAEQAGLDAVRRAQQALDAAADVVAGLPSVAAKGGLWGSPSDFSLFERSPLSGRVNALAMPLSLSFAGPLTRGHATYGAAYEGPPGSVHGGYVIAAFDDLLGVAQAASGQFGFTGTLTVRLVNRTPLHQRIDYEAEVGEVSGRKVTVTGRSRLGDTLLAEATGIFIAARAPAGSPVPGQPGLLHDDGAPARP